MEWRRQTSDGVRKIIKNLIEEEQGKLLWGEVKNVLLSNEKRLFDDYIDSIKRLNNKNINEKLREIAKQWKQSTRHSR